MRCGGKGHGRKRKGSGGKSKGLREEEEEHSLEEDDRGEQYQRAESPKSSQNPEYKRKWVGKDAGKVGENVKEFQLHGNDFTSEEVKKYSSPMDYYLNNLPHQECTRDQLEPCTQKPP